MRIWINRALTFRMKKLGMLRRVLSQFSPKMLGSTIVRKDCAEKNVVQNGTSYCSQRCVVWKAKWLSKRGTGCAQLMTHYGRWSGCFHTVSAYAWYCKTGACWQLIMLWKTIGKERNGRIYLSICTACSIFTCSSGKMLRFAAWLHGKKSEVSIRCWRRGWFPYTNACLFWGKFLKRFGGRFRAADRQWW